MQGGVGANQLLENNYGAATSRVWSMGLSTTPLISAKKKETTNWREIQVRFLERVLVGDRIEFDKL